MPARLKILVFLFIVFAFTNAGNAVFIVYRQAHAGWLARASLSLAGSGAFLICAYSLWRKRKEACWFSTAFVAALMAMTFAPDLYRFGAFVSQRSQAELFSADIQIYWARAVVFFLFMLGVPFLVYRVISSEKSKLWLAPKES